MSASVDSHRAILRRYYVKVIKLYNYQNSSMHYISNYYYFVQDIDNQNLDYDNYLF